MPMKPFYIVNSSKSRQILEKTRNFGKYPVGIRSNYTKNLMRLCNNSAFYRR